MVNAYEYEIYHTRGQGAEISKMIYGRSFQEKIKESK